MADVDWPRIMRELAEPFAAPLVEWRPQGKTGPGAKVRLVPYLRAVDVQDRLDAVCGADWSFELEPVIIEAGELKVARGRLTIHGRTRDGLGTATNWEPSKGCASDAIKRAAAVWGVGRYLAQLPHVTCTLDAGGNVPDSFLATLRERLARRAA